MLKSVQQKTNSQKIIADIGGTNARFALLNSDGSIQDQIVLKAENHDDFVSAYKAYLALVGQPIISQAAIAIANPIDGDEIKMTNHHWEFSISEARKALALDDLIFKNDFEALAMSIPYLADKDTHQLGGTVVVKEKPIGVLGPGTGLGVSSLIYSEEKWITIPGEGGHVSLSATTVREIEILSACLGDYQHVSAERLISGSGLKLLYKTICELDQLQADAEISAHEISAQAISKTNQQCIEALDMFSALLGVVAGNLALTLGAKGGIYIGGGIVPKLGSYFDGSPFRKSFEAKGRFKNYLEDIPVFVIKSENPALIGVSQVFS